MTAAVKPGYCQACGRELGVNDKLRGARVHAVCPLGGSQGSRRATPRPPVGTAKGSAVETQVPARPTVASALRVVGWIDLVIGVILSLAAAQALTEAEADSAAIGAAIGGILISVHLPLVFFALAYLAERALQIAANSHHTRPASEKRMANPPRPQGGTEGGNR